MNWAVGLLITVAMAAAIDKDAPSFVLGGQIADAARVAERTPQSGDARQEAVALAAQRVISVSGEKPSVVQTALETVLTECQLAAPADTRSRGYQCYGTQEAQVAIERLLTVVRRLAALELSPGAGPGDGIGELGPPPPGGGGADYSAIPR